MKMTDADERALAVMQFARGYLTWNNMQEFDDALQHIRARLAADQQKGGGEVVAWEARDPADGARWVTRNPRERDGWQGLGRTIRPLIYGDAPQPSIPAPAQQDGKASGGEVDDAMIERGARAAWEMTPRGVPWEEATHHRDQWIEITRIVLTAARRPGDAGMNDKIELLPCPFCGSAEVGDEHVQTYSVDSSYDTFGCRTCGAVFVDGGHREWNRRAPKPEAQAAWKVLQIGNYGAAYDLPNARRAFTYEHQPGNVLASRLGSAATAAVAASAGDSIDRGLSLLKSLQDEGFGVFQVDAAALSTPASHDATHADAMDPEIAKLVAFFRGEGYQRFGWEGDVSGWSPADTAIKAMRSILSSSPGDGATHLIATISQAFAEVRHALDVGPNWYTRGEGGMFMQVDSWVRKGAAAAEKLSAQKEGNGNG